MSNTAPVDPQRRRLLAAGALSLLSAPFAAVARDATPRQSAGPFYPNLPLLDEDNDLTRVPGQEGPAMGEIADLSGQVLDTQGRPLAGLRVEIWQCDANGRYRHSRDRQSTPMDPAFQGFGHATTDAEGRYRFRTIRPVAYPGRAPHIHAAVFGAGERPFVTQIYAAGDPGNAGDFLYQRVPAELRALVQADFQPAAAGMLDARFDFVLAGALATG